MKLTKKDKEYLLSVGVNEKDFQQMQDVGKYTKYHTFNVDDESIVTTITQKKVIEILGRNTYLSGLHRAAFHHSAVRYSPDEKDVVIFDCDRFFDRKS